MLKKMILVAVLFLAPHLANADALNISDVVAKVPALKQGIAYSIEDGKINYLSTIEIVKWKGFSLEGGYAGAAQNTAHKLVGVVSYQVARLKDYVEIPVLDLLEFNIGAYAGYGRIAFNGDTSNDNEFDYGISATLLNIKF